MVYTVRFFPLQNAVCFIILTYLVPVLFTFYIQGVLKLKNNSGAKRLSSRLNCENRHRYDTPRNAAQSVACLPSCLPAINKMKYLNTPDSRAIEYTKINAREEEVWVLFG